MLTDRPDALLWSGLTDNYLRVTAQAPPHLDLSNRITPARLDELHGETLYGEPQVPEPQSCGHLGLVVHISPSDRVSHQGASDAHRTVT